jgi:hypothetical protein
MKVKKTLNFVGQRLGPQRYVIDWSRSALSDFIVRLKATRDQLKAVLR